MPRTASTHVDDPVAVGARLRRAREAAGLTQRQLAFRGCTPAYISRIERGTRIPSLQILRELGDRLGVSAEFLATGAEAATADHDVLFEAEVAARLGDKESAVAIYRDVIATQTRREPVSRAQAGLGFLAFEDGDHDKAITFFQQALDGTTAGPHSVMVADRLGRAYALTSRYEEALALFTRYLDEARDRNDPIDTVRFSVLLANTYIDRCDFSDAERLLSGVLEPAKNALDPTARASVYWAQSRLHSSKSEAALAARYARLALSMLEQTEHTGYIANALVLLATLENDQEHFEEAFELVEQAEPALRATGNRYDLGRLQLERARAELGRGNRNDAAALALGSIPLLVDASPVNVGRGYAIAASIFRQLGEAAKAMELYELAAETFPTEDRHAADTYMAMADIAEETGDKDAALRYLRRAVDARSTTRRVR